MWNQSTFRILFCNLIKSSVEIVTEATISIFFTDLAVGVIYDIYILSIGHRLANADPAGTFYSCSGTQNEEEKQNNLIEVEIRTFLPMFLANLLVTVF